MFDRSSLSHAESEALNPEQRQLLRLNVDFLKLLMESSRMSGAPAAPRSQLNLPPAQSAQLIECSEQGLQRMAACGFSLFSLSMHRADLWQRAGLGGAQAASQYAWPAGNVSGDARSGFMACALFFAWHLAQQAPRAARFLLGMSDDCAAIVTSMELWQCGHIAQTHSHLLSPRWQHHPYFWTDLLRYGSTGDAQHFKFARMLGSQLMAQELEPSAIMRLSSTE